MWEPSISDVPQSERQDDGGVVPHGPQLLIELLGRLSGGLEPSSPSEVQGLDDPRDADALWDVAAGARGGDPSMTSAGKGVALFQSRGHCAVVVGEPAVSASVKGNAKQADVRVFGLDSQERLEFMIRRIADRLPASAAGAPGSEDCFTVVVGSLRPGRL